MLIQRTQIFYRAKDQGIGDAPKVAAHMGGLLGWSPEDIERNVAQYQHDVSLSRAWLDACL
jgi:hypothetical protein